MSVQAVSPESVGVKVGDIFSASWGYDQTNVDFYKVVATTAKSVKVVQVQSRHTDSWHVLPSFKPVKGAWVKCPEGGTRWDREAEPPTMTKRLYAGYRMGPCFTVASYANAYKVDPTKPQYQTAAGYGH